MRGEGYAGQKSEFRSGENVWHYESAVRYHAVRVIVDRLHHMSKFLLGYTPALASTGLFIALLLGGLTTCVSGQRLETPDSLSGLSQSVPATRDYMPGPDDTATQAQAFATLVGKVRDVAGNALPGVDVTLVGVNNGVHSTLKSDPQGGFLFADLRPGIYQVKVDAPGLGLSGAAQVVLGRSQRRQLNVFAMQPATQKTTVNVAATLEQIAEAQVKQQEQQRVLGFFPNYYTSYLWDAAPMTRKLKFTLALRTLTDPVTFFTTGAIAGVELAHNTFPGYGQGFEGYAKRYGATYADTVTARMLGSAIFPTMLHQDPRYYYQGSGRNRSRVLHALLSTVICRGDNGRPQPNFSHIAGSFGAAGLSNLYRTEQDRQAGLTFRNGLIILGGTAVTNVLREFLSRKITTNVPGFANGKP
ncbi:MAG: carboxypeptidase-like regulatory domain-containing protein [Bryobacteraceae bacterium]